MELRVLGAPWTLHSWTLSLSSAHEARSEGACSQLLRDFIQLLPEDKQQMQQLAQDCLPLLFAVFRAGKVRNMIAFQLFESYQSLKGFQFVVFLLIILEGKYYAIAC